ncbi:hypothetical protein [Pseudonocardia sp. H11422]|uniref:hypothetical protein n=1 Tax=Pseudonocardia sp. H11422 TaxID=2835866 RepID=UPI001BDDA698|nr:hypothetical protein [Pseudonocardia sp. H11422]
MHLDRPPRRAAALPSTALLAVLFLSACTGGSLVDTERRGATPATAAAPPAPPAGCLLDVATFDADTGLAWAVDDATASDRRCIYNPAGTPGRDFVGVDVAPLTGGTAAVELDALGGVCDDGTRTPVAAGEGAFVCRFQGGSVFSAVVTGGRVVTVAVSGVPAGTTADRLAAAFSTQLTRIAR